MTQLLRDKPFLVLALLLGLTLASWLMLYSVSVEAKTAGAVLLFMAFVKVQLIISQYMELHKAILPIRIAFWAWTLGTGTMAITMYLP